MAIVKTPLSPAKRMGNIEPFHVMNILSKARALEKKGRSIIHMEIGEPDFVTSQSIIDAGVQSLTEGKTHYTPAVGLLELREAIANYYLTEFDASVSPNRIVITPGASGALQLILGTLLNSGDEVLMPEPGYPCNRHMVRLFDGVVKGIEVTAEDDFLLTIDTLKQHWTDKTRALMLASPSNPTGRLTPLTDMQAMLNVAENNNAALIVDEIYQGLVYDHASETALSIDSENLFVVNSFSKYFGMTGWRLGWLVAPESYVPVLDRLAQNIFLAAPTTAQYAAIKAFEPFSIEVLKQRRDEFKKRRDYLYQALADLGFILASKPDGAFYIYADISPFSNDSFEFAEKLLEEAGVAVTPGKDFGSEHAKQFVRFAYTTNIAELKEGVGRIKAFIQGWALS